MNEVVRTEGASDQGAEPPDLTQVEDDDTAPLPERLSTVVRFSECARY